MKKLLFTFLFAAAGLTSWATDYYIVGDATPFGWQAGINSMRKATKMTETSSGVFVWTGLLKNSGNGSGNGFYIVDDLSNWNGCKASSNQLAISDTGSDNYQTGADNKWNPTNTSWQYYTITLNTNTGKVSWVAGDEFTADGEGYYNINDVSALYCFSTMVNGGTTSINAKLTADIDYTACTTGMIGTNDYRYGGTFDGQGHTVNVNITNTAKGTGFFGAITGATIRNLVVDGTITASMSWFGGISGISWGRSTVENVVVKVTLNYTGSGDSTCGGILGDAESTNTLNNCIFVGKFHLPSGTNVGGLIGWTNDNTELNNCLVAPAEITVSSGFEDITFHLGKRTNCYKVAANDAKLASGEMCYKLNGNVSGGTRFYQTIGTDTYPVPFPTSKKVFSTNNTPAYVNFDIVDNKIQIGSPTDLTNFSRVVNAGSNILNAVLTADITADASFTPIGTNDGYRYGGTFDGNGHTVTIDIQSTVKQGTGFFGTTQGATIRNLIVDGNVESSQQWIGGIGGLSQGGTTVENAVSKVTLIYTGTGESTCGGIFGDMEGINTLNNGVFVGKFNFTNGGTQASGLISWAGTSTSVNNCLVAPAEVVTGDYSPYSWTGLTMNSYCYNTTASDARLASGEMCYLLNGSTNAGTNFYQTLGMDAYPIPFSSSKTIYADKWFNTSDNDVYYNLEGGNYTVYQLNLDEANTTYNVPANVTAKSVTMTRSFTTGKWNTFCSPIAIAKSNFSAVKELTSITTDGTHYTMTFDDIEDDNLVAGKPYMVQVSEAKSGFTATDATVAAAATPVTVENGSNSLTFTGVFAKGLAPEGSFIISSNAFYLVNSDVNLGAFRGYITTSSGSLVKALNYVFEDTEDGIQEVENGKLKVESSIYNVAGQRISKMQRGINIVNGRKVLF